ncbi:MAG: RNA methyltransferase, partial [Bacteroidetes bacterium]|nr:RNA methyltransferase [Bacteroidota bacterium]
MLPKTVIKQIRSLSLKKIRNQEKLFVVEGVKMVEEALRSEYVIREIYSLDAASFPNATIVTPLEMAQITHFSTPSPALALLEQAQNLESDTPFLERGTLYLGLEAIRDPGNLGTIIRIADWFGIHKIFASTDTAELYNPKV